MSFQKCSWSLPSSVRRSPLSTKSEFPGGNSGFHIMTYNSDLPKKMAELIPGRKFIEDSDIRAPWTSNVAEHKLKRTVWTMTRLKRRLLGYYGHQRRPGGPSSCPSSMVTCDAEMGLLTRPQIRSWPITLQGFMCSNIIATCPWAMELVFRAEENFWKSLWCHHSHLQKSVTEEDCDSRNALDLI